MKSIDLMRFPLIRKLVEWRALQFALMAGGLIGFLLVIYTGIFGTQNGAHSFAVVFVWIFWWFLLISLLLPFGARAWCGLCPIPALGEWTARRSFIGVRNDGKSWGLNRKWPKKLSNIWLSTLFFMGIATISIYLTTTPWIGGWLMVVLIVLAIVIHLVYEKRTFCKYVCPVGGFLSLYSMTSVLEIRARDEELCKAHKGKECVKGSKYGYGCPWMNYPGGMKTNNYCGFCTECLKTCPYDNMTIRTRPFGQDLYGAKRKSDEAYKSLIMLNLAILYLFVLLGPHAWIKDWASIRAGPLYYMLYLCIFFGSSLIFTPGLFFLSTWIGKKISGIRNTSKELFVTYAYSLVPMGLFAWIAFSVPIMMVSWAYVPQVTSDPYGWGWDVFHTKWIHWNPVYPELMPFIQVALILAGLFYSIKIGMGITKEVTQDRKVAFLSFLPVIVFINLVTGGFIWLFMG